ncbi:unnamed protein product, partial [Prorocentrum cordatum]
MGGPRERLLEVHMPVTGPRPARHSEDRAMRVAASGALATLASCCEEVAAALGRNESFGHLLESLARGADADVQHRATVAVSAVCVAEGSPAEA